MGSESMEALYDHIFDMEGVQEQPAYHGYSYGLLLVENGRPVCCFYVDDDTDQRVQYVLSHGMVEIYTPGTQRLEIYYGYVTDGERFFCEEMVYPRQNERGGIL